MNTALAKPPTQAEEARLAELLRNMGFDPDMVRNAAATVCSVVPDALVSKVYYHFAMRKVYTLPPADPFTGYSTLTVHNTYQLILNTSRSEDDIAMEGHQLRPASISGSQVADELVREFAGDHQANGSGGHIGVARIHGTEPTAEELAKLRQARKVFCNALVLQADDYFTQGNRKLIGFEHRRALKALGSEDIELHPWYIPIGRVVYTPDGCPACRGKVAMTAWMCPSCHSDLADYYMRRNKPVDAQTMPAIFDEIEFRKAEAKAAAKVAAGRTESARA